jgi:hypothetical protein
VSVQDRCTVCDKHTIGLEIVWTYPVVLLGDEAQVEAQFSLFVDSANLDTRKVHDFAPNIPQAQKWFLTHPMEPLGDMGHVESSFGSPGDSASVGAR